MSLLTLLVVLIVGGLVAYLISTLPIDARFKTVIQVISTLILIVWLLESIGLFSSTSLHLGRLR